MASAEIEVRFKQGIAQVESAIAGEDREVDDEVSVENMSDEELALLDSAASNLATACALAIEERGGEQHG